MRLGIGVTALSLAVSKSTSLRTTVPAAIVRKLGLQKGDYVEWDIDKVGKEWIATIKKKERDRM